MAAAVALSAVGVSLFLATPNALADSGATDSQPAATDTTSSTPDQQGQTSGTPDGTQPADAASTQVAGDTTSSTSESSTSDTSSSPSDTGSPGSQAAGDGTSTLPTDATSADPGTGSSTSPPAAPTSDGATTQTAAASATSDQSGAQNDNTTIRTDQGGNDGPVVQGNSDAATATSSASGGIDPTGSGSSSDASAASTQATAGNANVNVRVGSPGDSGATSQSNDAQAGAGASADGAGDPTGSDASATATTTQTSPGNANVAVRVNSPGDVGSTSQSNGAQASAGATGDPTAGPGASGAQATQAGASNVNVVVRVGSPGDNGPVSQQNDVTATGGTGPPTPVSADSGDTGAAGQTDQTLPTTGETDGLNAATTTQTIDQREGMDPPSVGEAVTPSGGAGQPSSVGSAAATQTGASNLNVSVRIGSPGADGLLTQTNSASATGTWPDVNVVTTDGGSNTNVQIVIPGAVSAPPGNDWQWNWVWDGGWIPPDGANAQDVAPTSDSSWSWSWSSDPPATGSATASDPQSTTAATATSTPGAFVWTWTWTLADGSTTTNQWQWSCACSWNWSWTWDWSGQAPASTSTAAAGGGPSSPAPQPSETYDTGAVTQQNSVAANAFAGVELQTNQTIDQPSGPNQSEASQVLASEQTAEAIALASMLDPLNGNLTWGVGTDTVDQANTLEADAIAYDHFDASQVTVQRQTSSPQTDQTMSSTQWTGNEQTAVAYAEADSSQAGNTNVARGPSRNHAHVGAVLQRNSATGAAFSDNWGSALQWTQQFQDAGNATSQDETAVNLLWNVQTSVSVAVAAQDGVLNVNDVLVPAGSNATNPTVTQRNLDSATANSIDYSLTQQWISQTQSGSSNQESSHALNVSWTSQTNEQSVTAVQTNDVHRAGWLGVEPTAARSGPAPPLLIQLPQSTPAGPTGAGFGPLLPPVPAGGGQTTVSAIAHTHSPVHTAIQQQTQTQAETETQASGALGAVDSTGVEHTSSRTSAPDALHVPGSASPDESAPGGGGGSGSGVAGSAPHGGGPGPFGLYGRPVKFVAPAHLGPQSQAPTLGRSVAFPDPLERPG